MQKGSNISAINESSLYTSLVVTIGDLEIESDKIADMEIKWANEFRVTGYLKINDVYDIVNTTVIDSTKRIVVYLSDVHGEYFSREFQIVNIIETKVHNDKLMMIEIQDVVSWELQNTYISKGFIGKKLSEVFDEYMALKVDGLLAGFPITKDLDSTIISRNLVVPENKNFLDFIEEELNKEGYVIYQDKKRILLKSSKNITKSALNKVAHVYKQVDENMLYGFKIIGYTMKYNTLKETNKLPSGSTIAYDPATKTMVEYSNNIDDIYTDIKSSKSEDKSQITNGAGFRTQEYLSEDGVFLKVLQTYERNSNLEIAVPGNVKFNKIYYIMDVLLAGNQFAIESQAKGDLRLSGEYVCTQIVDKIVPGEKFIQKLRLNRVDYGA